MYKARYAKNHIPIISTFTNLEYEINKCLSNKFCLVIILARVQKFYDDANFIVSIINSITHNLIYHINKAVRLYYVAAKKYCTATMLFNLIEIIWILTDTIEYTSKCHFIWYKLFWSYKF